MRRSGKIMLAAAWLVMGLVTVNAEKSDADKEAALANPYANDLGPAELKVDGYPKEIISGYKLLLDKCTKCHTSARPLNAQFLELNDAEAAAFKAKIGPDAENEHLYKIDAEVWKRYVKRMAAKPGCELTKREDQKSIHAFLVHDSKVRKMGSAAPVWIAHRRSLLDLFKKKYPERYKELYGGK